jgi:type VI secretion system protein ImpH
VDTTPGNKTLNIEQQRIEQELSEHPYRFDFFQAVRLMETLHPEKPRLGQGIRGVDDPIRLQQNVSLAFQPSTLTAFEYKQPVKAPYLSTAFFGLFGANGALPLHLSEYADERSRHHNDPTFVSFINLFQHRMLSFMYRAWADAQPTVSYDRYQQDRFKHYIGSFLGLGMDSLHSRDDIFDNLKLHFSGHYACQNKHPEGLRLIIESYFGINTRIQEFVGEWLVLPGDSICKLGLSRQTGRLGVNAIVGTQIWSKQHKFRIILGPMDWVKYEKLLSDKKTRKQLIAIVRNYIGLELDWDINLILKRTQVPATQLGTQSRLGWSCWMGDRPGTDDAGDLVLNFN